jgi:TPP-dependent pyruvate/acetoin dehydrogenase alpha subunit
LRIANRAEQRLTTVTQIAEIPLNEYAKHGLTKDLLREMLRKMLLLRKFEEKVEELFMKGLLIGPSHLYLGQEAIAVGAIAALQPEDLTVTTYRGHGHALAKDVPARLCMAELFGKSTGNCKGLGGSMHIAIYPKTGSMYATAIVGSGIPIAGGLGLGMKLQKNGRIVATFFGDGACNTGEFHEALNLISIWDYPFCSFAKTINTACLLPYRRQCPVQP